MRRATVLMLWITGCGGDGPGGDPDAAAPPPDAAADAAVDAPPGCDHFERFDEANGDMSTPEPTGLTLAEPITICGRIDAGAPAVDGVIDNDNLSVRIATAGDYAIRIVAPEAGRVRELRADVWGIAGGFRGWAAVSGGRGFGLFFPDVSENDLIRLRVYALDDAALDEPIDYEIELMPIDLSSFCLDPGGVADVSEAADGVDSTGNDVLMFDWPPNQWGPTYGLTGSATDLPEETGLVLAAGETATIDGVAGLHDMTDYLDRDTFAFETAADVGEVHGRLVWDDAAGTADDADIDGFLFRPEVDPAAVPQWLGSAQSGSVVDDDLMAAAVLPATRHLAFVVAYGATAAKPYRLILCAEAAP